MLFNSYPFLLLYLPVVLIGFFIIARTDRRLSAAWLALASLFFYGWWNVAYVPMLVGSVLFNFLAGNLLRLLRQHRLYGKAYLTLALVVAANLSLLVHYKYSAFFFTTLNALIGTNLPVPAAILPLGISFFTFTQIAYLVDTARGEVEESNFVHYLLFVTYFPHLIAGPILHHSEVMPQFAEDRTYIFRYEDFAIGLAYLGIGLFKKAVIADSFSADVAVTFKAASGAEAINAGQAWIGAIAYTLQIYFDFSGYSDMAVGLARMFGIRFPFNFDSPYQSASIIEFWRRWHMTLSRFLRDYLYIPLGGNARGPARRYVNLMITMLLGGLWHGANWTFLAWGGLHGLYLVINHGWRALRPRVLPRTDFPRFGRVLAILLTFFAVVTAWTLFRAPDIHTAISLLKSMAGLGGIGNQTLNVDRGDLALLLAALGMPERWLWCVVLAKYVGCLAIVFLVPNSQRIIELHGRAQAAEDSAKGRVALIVWTPTWQWGVAMGLLVAASMLQFTKVSEFLYFQF
jgi:alginate O-acetyltransferase complex protein AlgI